MEGHLTPDRENRNLRVCARNGFIVHKPFDEASAQKAWSTPARRSSASTMRASYSKLCMQMRPPVARRKYRTSFTISSKTVFRGSPCASARSCEMPKFSETWLPIEKPEGRTSLVTYFFGRPPVSVPSSNVPTAQLICTIRSSSSPSCPSSKQRWPNRLPLSQSCFRLGLGWPFVTTDMQAQEPQVQSKPPSTSAGGADRGLQARFSLRQGVAAILAAAGAGLNFFAGGSEPQAPSRYGILQTRFASVGLFQPGMLLEPEMRSATFVS